ncbi:MAG: NAD(P)H-binding protein [Myxococcota bacterium]
MSSSPSNKTDRILITGANGHLGRQLIAHLSSQQRVRALVRSSRAAAVLAALPERILPETRIVDYRDTSALEAAARGCRTVVHLVGIIKESRGASYREAHEESCQVLAAAAAAAGVQRIVYLSIAGANPDSSNACLASKGRAEEILLGGSVPAVILRVPMVLGPDDFASRALRAQARAKVTALIRGGASLQQPIDAADVCAAILAAAQQPGLDDTRLDLGGPECLSHRSLVERAAALYGGHPFVIPVPLRAMRILTSIVEKISANPPITRAMLEVLEQDDQLDSEGAAKRLGIELTPLDHTLERYLGEEVPAR